MPKILAFDSLNRVPESAVGRTQSAVPPRGSLAVSLASELETADRLNDRWPDESQSAGDAAGCAVIVMVGTTPHDENEIALELRRHGLQVVVGPVGLGRRTPGAHFGGEPSTAARPLVNRLLGIVGRRFQGSLHATTLTVGQPDVGEAGGPDAALSFGKLTIDYRRREVLVEGREIPLSKTEFGLLHLLALQAGRVFSRKEMVLRSKGAEYPVTERSIDVHVAAIRRKLGSAREHLQTVRGVGYRFNESPRQGSD